MVKGVEEGVAVGVTVVGVGVGMEVEILTGVDGAGVA